MYWDAQFLFTICFVKIAPLGFLTNTVEYIHLSCLKELVATHLLYSVLISARRICRYLVCPNSSFRPDLLFVLTAVILFLD